MRTGLFACAATLAFALASGVPAAAQNAAPGNPAVPDSATGVNPVTGVQRGQGTSQTGSSELGQRPQDPTTNTAPGGEFGVERTQNPGNPVATTNSAERDPVTGVQRGQGTSQTGSSELGARSPAGDRTTGEVDVIGKGPPVGGMSDPSAVPR